ncbi:MAG: glycosyltransferase family 4 protein [Planctomycetes bacterium]|nr:glycosyltransferase family 4 protein [Planctomycetota bacterium]
MKLLMLSGDRDTVLGKRGPFYYMQEVFSRHWERIDVLTPRAAGSVTTRVIHGNVWFHPSEKGRLGIVASHAAGGIRLAREHGHDVIVSHDYGSYYNGRAAARIARAAEIPWMSELFHVPGIPRASNWKERLEPSICKYYVRFAMRSGVGAFRVMNHNELPPFLRRCGVSDSQICYLSALYLDFDTFAPKGNVEKKWDLVFVGRMVANKGVAAIIDAIAILNKQFPRLRACFVGQGPTRAALEARAKVNGAHANITWIDWLATKEDLADLYRSSKLLVCASLNEGGPRVTCEAMACGTPVVTTPIGVMTDLIQNGTNGWIFQFDAKSLARAVAQALGDAGAYARAAAVCRDAVLPFEYKKTIGLYARGLQQLAIDASAGTATAAAAGAVL